MLYNTQNIVVCIHTHTPVFILYLSIARFLPSQPAQESPTELMLLTLLEHGTAKETGAPPVLPSGQHGLTRGQDMSVIKGLNSDDIKKAWTFLELRSWRVLFYYLWRFQCLFVSFCVFLVAFYWGKIGKMKMNSINPSYLWHSRQLTKDSSAAENITCYWHLNSAIRIQCHQCDWSVYAQGLFWLNHCFREINS